MANQIEREAWVKQDKLKNPIHYVRGTDLLPIVFHFRDFSIPSGATARVFIAKPDGNAVYDSATIEGNDVTVDVADQMFLVLGMTLMQISIFDGEEELVSFAQPVMVEQNLKAGDFPESTTDVSFLDDAIEQANQAVNTATTAASQAAQAVQNANQAIADANEAISDLNEQIASLNTNFASLSNNVSISQLQTTAKTLVGALNELNGKSYGKMTYYNANISKTKENRAISIKYLYDTYFVKFIGGRFAYYRVRYADDFYYNYIFALASGRTQVFEYGYDLRQIVLWSQKDDGTFESDVYFSDDATVQTNTESYMFNTSGEYRADCNDITQPGLCKKVATPTAPNSPGFYAYILVLLYKGGGMTNITQVAFPYKSKDAIKCRYRFNGEWSEWF